MRKVAEPQTCRATITRMQPMPSSAGIPIPRLIVSEASATPVMRLKPTTASVKPLISMAKPAISVGR